MTPQEYIAALNVQVNVLIEARDEVFAAADFVTTVGAPLNAAAKTAIRTALVNRIQAAATAINGLALDPL